MNIKHQFDLVATAPYQPWHTLDDSNQHLRLEQVPQGLRRFRADFVIHHTEHLQHWILFRGVSYLDLGLAGMFGSSAHLVLVGETHRRVRNRSTRRLRLQEATVQDWFLHILTNGRPMQWLRALVLASGRTTFIYRLGLRIRLLMEDAEDGHAHYMPDSSRRQVLVEVSAWTATVSIFRGQQLLCRVSHSLA